MNNQLIVSGVQVVGRGGSSFGRSEGDHTAAHALFRDTIATHLLGQPLTKAPDILTGLLQAFRALPGMTDERFNSLSEGYKENIYRNAAKAGDFITEAERLLADPSFSDSAKVTAVQNAAQAVLDFRNSIPLTAREFGGTGGGERPLRQIESFLVQAGGRCVIYGQGDGSWKVEHAVSASVSEIVTIPAPDKVLTRLTGLFDFAVLNEVGGDVSEEDRQSFPGITGRGDPEAILSQFYRTVTLAYPRLIQFLANRQVDIMAQLKTVCETRRHGEDEYRPGSGSGSDGEDTMQ